VNDPLAPMYRMPVSFGPAPGPRNLPASQRHRRFDKHAVVLTLSAFTDADALGALLPPGFVIDGEARLELVVHVLSDIGWLAGRGYNIVMVRIPARWQGQERVSGHFVPVVWENMADPILTGREELGWPKIFADVPQPVSGPTHMSGSAEWHGFRFLTFAADELHSCAPPAASPTAGPQPMMFHKYMPRTGEWGTADVDQMTIVEPGPPTARVLSCETGAGRFAFSPARWEDMPTQYPIVNALAALPLHGFGPAVRTVTSGGTDVSGQRILL
jgi:hypothetical protein